MKFNAETTSGCRGRNHGAGNIFRSAGWNDNQEYIFDIVFTSSLIQVKVDGQTELSYTGNFTDGSFGFYNFPRHRFDTPG